MTIAEVTPLAVAHAVGWALLHFLWQGAAIAAAVWLARRALPEPRAELRYLVGCAGLVVMLGLPLMTTIASLGPAADVSRWSSRISGLPPVLSAESPPRMDGARDIATEASWASSWLPSVRANVDSAAPWLAVIWVLGVAGLGLELGIGGARPRG